MQNDRLSVVEIARHVDVRSKDYCALSDRIWGMPELSFQEHRSSEEQIAVLESEGFRITRHLGGMATAFMAEAGEGGPVVGFLGEFDALPDLAQDADATTPSTHAPGQPGHGCGHNLLGTASALAAAALKAALEAEGIAGTVRYYGCPAEESGSGKTFMARMGAFDDLDAAFSWHPSVVNEVQTMSCLASLQVYFRFRGRASHAAATPHLGRSALDAVELMNVGVNYLREHMPPQARVHYSIPHPGGEAPNVVQAYAASLYLIRSPQLAEMEKLFERVKKIAEGAALMTETSLEVEITDACSNVLPNKVLQQAMYDNMQHLGPPPFDEEDYAFARRMREAAFTPEDVAASVEPHGAWLQAKILHDGILPMPEHEAVAMGSTDVGDVSWIVPTAQCHAACYAIGTPFHTWPLVAQGKRPAAHKGMILAAKTMAATGADVMRNPDLIQRAKAELSHRTNAQPYRCPIPDNVMPGGGTL